MTDTLRKHMIRYPAARPSTIQYLVKREEMTERLRREVNMAHLKDHEEISQILKEAANRGQKPRWPLLSWLLGRA
jgi:hypothetical protein